MGSGGRRIDVLHLCRFHPSDQGKPFRADALKPNPPPFPLWTLNPA